MRIDLIGSTSLHGGSFDDRQQPYEVRLRIAARAATAERAMIVGEEVEALYTNGPAGGGGARKYVQEQIGIVSTLLEREQVPTQVTLKRVVAQMPKLHELAHCRAGDKGDTSILSLIAYRRRGFPAACPAGHGPGRWQGICMASSLGDIRRYELPGLGALQFVCERSLNGGVTTSLAQDAHGKSLSYALLEMNVGTQGEDHEILAASAESIQPWPWYVPLGASRRRWLQRSSTSQRRRRRYQSLSDARFG